MKEYINFQNERPSKTGKTKVWDVTSIHDEVLGEIATTRHKQKDKS